MPAHARHRKRHRGGHSKPLGAKRERPILRYSATAGVALVGASLFTAAPAAPAALPTPPALRVASEEVRLAAAASILNIPLNLAIDLINAPYNEVQAVDYAAKSLFFSGPWMVVSSTNLWGVDPGDPSHFQSATQLAIPFPALSGFGLDQNDQNGLGQQVWHTIAALLPVDKSCDAEGCTPNVPTSPITGVAAVDSLLWIGALLTGVLQLPLTSNWFTASAFSQLLSPTGYTYDATNPGYVDPSGPANPIYFNPDGTPLFPGTEVGPNGENLLPWHDTTFTLDPFKPVQNYLNHLMADPATNPIQLPTFEQIGRAIQAFAAAVVMAFDPITPGSPFCPGDCGFLPASLDYPALVKGIGDLWPGNTTIDTWLAAYNNGTANVPTQAQIDRSVEILQQRDFWDFQNPSPPASYSPVFNLSTLAADFHKMWTDFGFNPPPLNPAVDGGSDDNSPVSPLAALQVAAVEKTTESTTGAPQVSGEDTPPDGATPQDGGLTSATGLNQGLPSLTGSGTQIPGSAPSNDTARKPGFVSRLVNEFLPHPSGANGSGASANGSGTSAKKPGAGANGSGAGAKKTSSDTKKAGSGSGTSTGKHSRGGSAG